MRELHLIGVHEGGEFLLLGGDDDARFSLPIDDAVRAAVRWERRRHSAGGGGDQAPEPMRPREVQAMIRAGASTEEAAERAGWTVEKVRRFEGPIVAEREYMAQQAGRAHVRARSGQVSLADRVQERLLDRGVDLDDIAWDSWRSEDGQWTVELSFPAGGRRRTAAWSFLRSTMTVIAVDDEARWLSDDIAHEPPAQTHVMSTTRTRVYDVEAEGGLRAAAAPTGRGDGGTEDDDLIVSMRERSTARSRRRSGGRRAHGPEHTSVPVAPPVAAPVAPSVAAPVAVVPTPISLPDLGTPNVPDEVVPLVDIDFDPDSGQLPPGAHSDPDPGGLDGQPEPLAAAYVDIDEVEDDEPELDLGPDQNSTEHADEEVDEPANAQPRAEAVVEEDVVVSQAVDRPTDGEGAATYDEPMFDVPVGVVSDDTEGTEDAEGTDNSATATDGEHGVAGVAEDAERVATPPPPRASAKPRRKGRASVPAWDDIMFGARPGAPEE